LDSNCCPDPGDCACDTAKVCDCGCAPPCGRCDGLGCACDAPGFLHTSVQEASWLEIAVVVLIGLVLGAMIGTLLVG
jgi:hypothetical protein